MKEDPRTVTVRSPARLHLGFLDLNGSRGRRYGSVGLTLDGLGVSLTATRARSLSASGPQAARAEAISASLHERFGLPCNCRLEIREAIPEHVGLGSGTQLAIAVGVALARCYRLDLGVREIAVLHERGQRSGIGIGAFEAGGFLIDGGKGARDEPPPLVARAEFPPAWRALLVFDRAAQGLHGADEIAAFQKLPAFSEQTSAHLCRLMLMQALPALQERDLDAFGRAIGEMQRITGDYFAPAQGGRFSSPRVAEILAWLESEGVAGIGQSSWGPTGFAIVATESDARMLARRAQARAGDAGALQFMVCAGRNRGGEVDVVEAAECAARQR